MKSLAMRLICRTMYKTGRNERVRQKYKTNSSENEFKRREEFTVRGATIEKLFWHKKCIKMTVLVYSQLSAQKFS